MFNYSCAVRDERGQLIYEEGSDRRLEAASVIKSAIAALAIAKAYDEGGEFPDLIIQNNHIPERATTALRDPSQDQLDKLVLTKSRDGYAGNLIDIVKLSISRSDAAAFNCLLDYSGGKGVVNSQLHIFDLVNTDLLTNHLDFKELEKPDLSHRVGTTTPRDMSKYFHNLKSNIKRLTSDSIAETFMGVHLLTERARFFSCQREKLPKNIRFYHKTGSIFNPFSDGSGQAVIADAGIIAPDGRPPFTVTAHLEVYRPEGLAGINREFFSRNLNSLKHAVPDFEIEIND